MKSLKHSSKIAGLTYEVRTDDRLVIRRLLGQTIQLVCHFVLIRIRVSL